MWNYYFLEFWTIFAHLTVVKWDSIQLTPKKLQQANWSRMTEREK